MFTGVVREDVGQPGRQPVAGDVEEPALAAGGLELPRYFGPRRGRPLAGQRAHVDDRQRG
jgi:hypothetical protein